MRIRALLLGLAVGFAGADASAVRAVGGVRLIQAMEAAPATVVARIERTRALGSHGYGAVVRVETAVTGEVQPGAELEIAWEELSTSRAPRFAAGERALMVLEPLSGASIWRARLPDTEERLKTLGVAERGDAFLRSPSPASTLLLQHYLALAPEAREGATGIDYLARLVEAAELPLAIAAVESLAQRNGLAAALAPESARQLAAGVVRAETSAGLQQALLDLIGRHRPESMRAPLEALAAGPELASASVYLALARLDGALSPQRTLRLLKDAPGPQRRVAVRYASGPRAEAELRSILRGDPSAQVRSAAVVRLAELGGLAAVAPIADVLRDPEPQVRAAAAQQLGSFGAGAVPELRRIVDGTDPDATRAAIVALALTESPAGVEALGEIASEHSDAAVREFARLALGSELGHRD